MSAASAVRLDLSQIAMAYEDAASHWESVPLPR